MAVTGRDVYTRLPEVRGVWPPACGGVCDTLYRLEHALDDATQRGPVLPVEQVRAEDLPGLGRCITH